MLELILTVVLVAFASTGCVALARALPWPAKVRDAKPIGCPACLSGWMSLVMIVFATIAGYLVWRGWQGYVGGFVIWMASTGLSVYLSVQAGVFATPGDLLTPGEPVVLPPSAAVPPGPTIPPGTITRAP